jgi:hypothetical protein
MKAQIKYVRDKTGRLLYSTVFRNGRLKVRNRTGKMLGYVKNKQTRDASGRLVARGKAPALLLVRKDCLLP